MKKKLTQKAVMALSDAIRSQVIRAAWEDDVSFDSIQLQYGFTEQETITIMKTVMKPKMFVVWRQRVQGRPEKHFKKMCFVATATL